MAQLTKAALAQIQGAADAFGKVAARSENGGNGGYTTTRVALKGTVVSSNAIASIPHGIWNFGFQVTDEKSGEISTVVVWNSPRFPTPRLPVMEVEAFLDILETKGEQEINVDLGQPSKNGIVHAVVAMGQSLNFERLATLRAGYRESVSVMAGSRE